MKTLRSGDSPVSPRRASSGRTHSPTREALLRRIETADHPCSIVELANETGWHPNTVRSHVHALWRDGYLSREADRRSAPGRPSWLWRATRRPPAAPYAALAVALATALARSSPTAEHAAREAGRDWGRALAAEFDDDSAASASDLDHARALVIEVMRDQGFAPSTAGSTTEAAADEAPEAGGSATISLRQCPLIEATHHNPDIVCTVHRGLVEGLLETVAPSARTPQTGTPHKGGGSAIAVDLTPFSAVGVCALRLTTANESAA